MTFQVFDVLIADSDIRRLVLIHGAIAFFYATGILALIDQFGRWTNLIRSGA